MFILRISHLVALCTLAASAMSAPTDSNLQSVVRRDQATYEANMRELLKHNPKCSNKNVVVRRAWDDLSPSERQNYIDAVKCLQKKPAKTSRKLAPGVRSRFDDYVYTHINQSNFMHGNGVFFPWHREYLWQYEQQLRDECGYRGYQPYWAWERSSADQSKSPVFQPGPYNFGGNGRYVKHDTEVSCLVGVNATFCLPPRASGTGGGCITDGPFANFTLDLGPVSPANNTPDNLFGYQYNPRCMVRDFSPELGANLTYKVLADLWAQQTLHDMRPMLELTAHGPSHAYIGGSAWDFYASPEDPMFYMLHTQIDRLWTVWQGLDYKNRRDALDGTVTTINIPPSENATLATTMHFATVGRDKPISVAMSTIENNYCYIYG